MNSFQVWPVGPAAGSGGQRCELAERVLPRRTAVFTFSRARRTSANRQPRRRMQILFGETSKKRRTAVSVAHAKVRSFGGSDLPVGNRRLLSTGAEQIDDTQGHALSRQGAQPGRNRSFFQGSGAACQGALERAAGIEPASLAWKAKVLPLHNARVSDGNYSGARTSSRTDVRGALA